MSKIDQLILDSIGRYHDEYPELFERYVREQTHFVEPENPEVPADE